MKANLIIIDTQDNLTHYQELYSALQNKLITSTVEFTNTTVFSDYEDALSDITKFIGKFTVIIHNLSNQTRAKVLLDQVLVDYYHAQAKSNGDLTTYSAQNAMCYVLDMQTVIHNIHNIVFPVNDLNPCAFLQVYGLSKTQIRELYSVIPNSRDFDIAIFVKDMVGQVSITPKQDYPSNFVDNFLRNVYLQFQNNWFGDTQDSLLDRLNEILSIRKLNLCVADSLTKGEFQQYLCQHEELLNEHISEIFTITQEYDFQFELGIDMEFLETHTTNGVDMAYEMSAVMMEKGMADIVISLCGDQDTWFVSIGDKQAIHVYKYTNTNNLKVMCNQAIFKLLKKLRENQLYFFENSV